MSSRSVVDKKIWKDTVIRQNTTDIMWVNNNNVDKSTPTPSMTSEDSGNSSGSSGMFLRVRQRVSYFSPASSRSSKTPATPESAKSTLSTAVETKEKPELKKRESNMAQKNKNNVAKKKSDSITQKKDINVANKKESAGNSQKKVSIGVGQKREAPSKVKDGDAKRAKVTTPQTPRTSITINSPLRERAVALDFQIEDSALVHDQRDLNTEPKGRPRVLPLILPEDRLKPIICELVREESFSASHRLHNPYMSAKQNVQIFDKCNGKNGHGHNYRVKVYLKGPINNHTGMVYNMKDLKEEMKLVIDTLDHKNIDQDVPFFKTRVSTSENLAYYIMTSLQKVMSCAQLLSKVELWETDKNSVVIHAHDQ
ncbi:unnamed protein product [Bursaphelenchus okinawaensis]|uniref:6-pyruvoyltetrahydropterin synthase n=1 Tax=Bursaphelenchus okinawaensis TaxID=465554 RepID=A0A811JU96_9BILA|nr:unnamed protein product [Bursaphelenchus okinawaensis]CAG9083352.1 unnamed protein product [Bursaphelenchus okinawaensis]